MHRRGFLTASLAATALPAGAAEVPSFVDDLQARTFRFFWETTNPANGLAPDRWPTPSPASIAAVGFSLTALPIGVERGWVSRAAARSRVLATLRFLTQAPQGPQADASGYKGFFYHFLDMTTGRRVLDCELSTVDTALLMSGILFCQSYFGRADPGEAEIRDLAETLYGRVDWAWAGGVQSGPGSADGAITMGWLPDHGFLPSAWRGYNEAMIVGLLALGSPTRPAPPAAWTAYQRDYDRSWGLNGGPLPHLGFAPMFGHQYTHVWIDFRGIADGYMRRRGIDYFENSRRATLAQRAYAIANPLGWKDYGPQIWGLTACDGPGDIVHEVLGVTRRFYGYTARGPGHRDDGTIAPTAAISSIPFAPEICTAAALAMSRRYGAAILGRHGFRDAFNPTFGLAGVAPSTGSVVPGAGWVSPDHVGIDQGPIVGMIENARSGLIWRVMRGNPHVVRGLRRAGFTGGWLERG